MSQIRVGIDVGENSVGLAALRCDDEGFPLKLLRTLVVLHDNGKDGMASGQSSSVSRKASGGAARRVRKLLRGRRKRALALEKALTERGYPLTDSSSWTTYEPWQARISLLDGYIDDEAKRHSLIATAIRHMSNHRGWANAWVDFDTYIRKDVIEKSKEFDAAVEKIIEADIFEELTPEHIEFQADLAELALNNDIRIRPRTKENKDLLYLEHTLGKQMRVDVAREWKEICNVQQVSDEDYFSLARIAFKQEKPKVPVENVGNDWLPGFTDKKRASIASLEHQEFQIRQTIANLAIRADRHDSNPRRLSVNEQNLIVEHLLGVTTTDQTPTWRDIAEEFLDIEPVRLVHSDQESSLAGNAPIMRSVVAIHKLTKKHPVHRWWMQASPELRSAFILWWADPSDIDISDDFESEFTSLFESFAEDEKLNDQIVGLKFPSGRSAHSLDSLRLMTEEMRTSGNRYIEVRNKLFNDGKDLRPTELQSLDTVADHPTLQRILPIVRRFLIGINREFGEPDRIVIEHVRGAFLGMNAKKEAANDIANNRRSRERAQQAVVDAGYSTNPATVSDSMVKRFQAIQRQGSACLYCGWSSTGSAAWGNFELDHIVPRASGGNSTRANLVAVCRDCNSAKGKAPFAVFAHSGRRPEVTLDGAIERAKSIHDPELRGKALFRLRSEIISRLKQTEDDEQIDERALGSTAYAAVDLVRRINTHYHDDPASGRTKVFSGRIVSMARHSSGIDKAITIRDGVAVKSRFDRRHHAIDAAVAAMLSASVAKTLAQRDDLRRAAFLTGDDPEQNWKRYSGDSVADRQLFDRWKKGMVRLSKLLAEQIRKDQLNVMYPVRYSAHHAALHEDGRVKHVTKKLGEAWTYDERSRVVDNRVYEQLSASHLPSKNLPQDDFRSLTLPSGVTLGASGSVYLFPDAAARIALPNLSSAKLGSSMHHIRVYRWKDDKGRVQTGVVRVWAADLYELEGGVNSDLLNAHLPPTSHAVRRAHIKVQDAIWNGSAKHVGTLMIGDEVLLDPDEWIGDGATGEFFKEFPEARWRLNGFESNTRLNLKPILLSTEGIAKEKNKEDQDPRKVVVSDNALKVITGMGLRLSVPAFLGSANTQIIRRTGTGKIRRGKHIGLPSSWSIFEAIHGE